METNDDEFPKKVKRHFAEAWLTNEKYKSWIRKVPYDNSLYHCVICNKNFSCSSVHISRHAESAYHKNNMTRDPLSNDDEDFLAKKSRRPVFQPEWLEIDRYKYWLREVPHDESLFHCIICNKSLTGGLSQIHRHGESKAHLDRCKNNIEIESRGIIIKTEVMSENEDSNMQSNETNFLFNERRKSAEMRYAALIAEKNISHQIAEEILSFFQEIGKDSNVLKNMSMGRTKCTNIMTNVLCPIETERVVDKTQNTKFTIIINETPEISNCKWLTFIVRYVDPETLDVRSQLIKLIDIDPKDCSPDKFFEAFQCEMSKLQIPFANVIALSCENTSIMTEEHLSFKTKLKEICPNLLTFPCPCHSVALAAHAACAKMPEFCEEFIISIADYINSSPKRSAVCREFSKCSQETNRKMLKLSETHWISHYLSVEKLLESWDTIQHFLSGTVTSEKTNCEEYLLSMMNNVEMKAYFLFLKYVLKFFKIFIAFFQVPDTRIYLLHQKSVNLLYQICRHFLRKKHLKPFAPNTTFSIKENRKIPNRVSLGSECEKYLDELIVQGHTDVITNIRKNCLEFYITAAEELRERLPVNDIFLSKLQAFSPSNSLYSIDREASFNDVAFVARTFGDFDEDALKREWMALPLDFTINEQQNLSKLNFDNMWRKIAHCRYPNDIAKYPHLTNVLNLVRSLPNSSTDPEMFSLLNNLKAKKRNKLLSVSVNAICVIKSALKARGEKPINMMIERKHLSFMSANKLYQNAKKYNTLKPYIMGVNDTADVNDSMDINDTIDVNNTININDTSTDVNDTANINEITDVNDTGDINDTMDVSDTIDVNDTVDIAGPSFAE
ncbi:uncharacterized protein LOC105195594 [Solenopsis invicta]|uniref:uncharacterized protein LOC105195594 n=1 Tax=Solenopsis invicta TaxID=13686 RepID=UPI000595C29D|nr:uncharacterized protein LOC105195594 [Solenopsis invicta]